MTPESQESQDDPPEAGRGPVAEPPGQARRRAIAYLDLWERQLAQMASEGAVQPRRLTRGRPG